MATSPDATGRKEEPDLDGSPAEMRTGKGPRVGVIGAGVSGLAACKHFSQRGLNVTVLEAKSGIGGLWRDTYASTALQTSRRLFEFSDFPWPESASEFPMHQDLMEYLEGYAQQFGLLDKIQFDCQVVQIRRADSVATDGWKVEDESEGLRRRRKDRNLMSEVGREGDVARHEGALWEVHVKKKEKRTKKIPESCDSPGFSEEVIILFCSLRL